jgi:glutamate---cysteine ligase / carboxylate-amine ligase
MLLDPLDFSLVRSSETVLRRLLGELRIRTAPEMHASVIELVTGIHSDVPGRDSGFASARTTIFQGFPRTGTARRFSSYADYVRALDPLIGAGAVPDPSFLWWDVRLQPELGTVEVRVMDAQSTVADSAALIALVQSLARLELESESPESEIGAEVLAENRFLAARDGLQVRLIDPIESRLVPAGALLDAMLARCRAHARALGCSFELDQVRRLAAGNGSDRQRARALVAGLLELVQTLSQLFSVPSGRPFAIGEQGADDG